MAEEEKGLPDEVNEEVKKELSETGAGERGQEVYIEVLPYWIRIGVVDEGKLAEFVVDTPGGRSEFISGNIYKGIIKDVIPSMQAVFIDIGMGKNAYLFVPSKSKIEEYKTNSEIIVQIKKESIDSKGAKVSDNPTIPGKYVVLTLERKSGVSKKIKSKFERTRLKRIVSKLADEINSEFGVVARTEAAGVPEELIRDDFYRVVKVFQEIKERMKLPAPVILWSDEDILRKVVRDFVSQRVKKIVSNSYKHLEDIKLLISEFFPSLLETIHIVHDDYHFIFDKYGLEDDFFRLLQDEISIEGGIKIVFNETEAFTAIDVNTASFTGAENLDVTAYQANLIAIKEIMRQIRLRRLGGIIIVDLIDIKSNQLKSKLIKEIRKLAEKDREKTRIFGLTKLGLLEMSRRKAGYSLKKILTEKCPTCQEGNVHSSILKTHLLLKEIARYQGKTVKVSAENFKVIEDFIKNIKINVRVQPKYGLGKWEIEV